MLKNSNFSKSFVLGTSLLMVVFNAYFFQLISSFFGIHLIEFIFPLSIFFVGILLYFYDSNWKQFFISSGTLLGILIFSVFISSIVIDTSYDGLWYQLEGVFKITNGWNPWYEDIRGEEMSEVYNTYTKGPWIYGGTMYGLTGFIDSAKCFNWILMFSVSFYSYYLFYEFLKYKLSIALLLSFLVITNPVSLSQLFTYYIDGQLSNLLIILIILLIICYENPLNKFVLFIIAIDICILCNIKITGFIYASIFCFIFIIALILRNGFKVVKIPVTYLFIGFFISIFFFGYNPYVKNSIEHGHPFYPMNKPFIEYHEPSNFVGKNNVYKAAVSHLSYSSYKSHDDFVEIKQPFDLTDINYNSAEIRTGGFGSFFRLIIYLSFIILLLEFPYLKNHKLETLIIFTIFFSSIINPGVWWARYVPQLYLIPLVIYVMARKSLSIYSSRLSLFLITLLTLNSINNLRNVFSQTINKQIEIKEQLNSIKKIDLYRGKFKIIDIQLQERGIEIYEHNLNCSKPQRLEWGPDSCYFCPVKY